MCSTMSGAPAGPGTVFTSRVLPDASNGIGGNSRARIASSVSALIVIVGHRSSSGATSGSTR